MSHGNSLMTLDAVACRALRLVLAMTLLVEEQHPVVAPIVLVPEIGIAWRRQSWIAGRFDLFWEGPGPESPRCFRSRRTRRRGDSHGHEV
jgi:hypothetical protein